MTIQSDQQVNPYNPFSSYPKRLTKEARRLQLEIIKQMLTLATSGFGLVAALAWNEMIKEAVDTFVKPYLPQGSGVVSLFAYAVLVTVLAVFITVYLTRIKKQLQEETTPATQKK